MAGRSLAETRRKAECSSSWTVVGAGSIFGGLGVGDRSGRFRAEARN